MRGTYHRGVRVACVLRAIGVPGAGASDYRATYLAGRLHLRLGQQIKSHRPPGDPGFDGSQQESSPSP